MSHYQKTTYPNHKTNLPALSFGGGFDKWPLFDSADRLLLLSKLPS
jgi:hypothetical protein